MQNKGILESSLCLYWMLNASGGSHGFGQNQRAAKCWDTEAVNSYISLALRFGTIPQLQHWPLQLTRLRSSEHLSRL